MKKISDDPLLDRRTKLTEEDKENILYLRNEFEYSKNSLARMYSVSVYCISEVLDPGKNKESQRLYRLSAEKSKNSAGNEKKCRERRKKLNDLNLL